MESQENRGCLICGKTSKSLNRGLCSTHHSRYYSQVRKMSPETKAIFDQELIEAGFLLPLQKRGPKVSEDPFAAIAIKLLAAENGLDYVTEADEESVKASKKKLTRKKNPRKKKS